MTTIKRIDEVDGLRAVAMTMVIGIHCHIFPVGWAGVWVFYVISGFVISRTFIVEGNVRASRHSRYLDFMWRRAVRILPAYLVFLAIASGLMVAAGQTDPLRELPYLLTFTANWQRAFGIEGIGSSFLFDPLWSLSVEEQFYLFFPLLFLFLRLKTFVRLALVLIVLIPILRIVAGTGATALGASPGRASVIVYFASILHFDAFLVGALLALNEDLIRDDPRVAFWLKIAAVIVGVGYVGGYLFVDRVMHAAANVAITERSSARLSGILYGTVYGQGREGLVYVVFVLAAAATIAGAIRAQRWTRPLRFKPLVWIGRISYGGYLYHMIPIWLLNIYVFGLADAPPPVPQRLAVFGFAFAVTILLAWLSFRFIEAPARRWAAQRQAIPISAQAVH